MDGIGATRSATGETVEIGLDRDGQLRARTPDGAVLQARPAQGSRIKLKGDRLTWSGVEYTVDDEDDARSLVDALATPRTSAPRWAARIAAFVVALALGVAAGAYLNDRQATAGCDEARDVVGAALATMAEINEIEVQDQSFFAALVVEQREITFTMGAAPRCFSLTERAEAEGLLEGISGLLDAAPG